MNIERNILEQQVKIFKCIGHPARLKMACLLRKGQKSVSELTESVKLEMPTVSKHLSVLKEAQIVSSSKQANNVFYKLELCCLDNFLECSQNFVLERICCKTTPKRCDKNSQKEA